MQLLLLALEIEWHWQAIMRIRNKGGTLLNRGMPLTSQKFIRLNRRLSVHSARMLRIEAAYKNIAPESFYGQHTF